MKQKRILLTYNSPFLTKVWTIIPFIIILLFFSSCKKEYQDLSEKRKEAFLYYSYKVGDTFCMLRTDSTGTDTINYKVIQNELGYGQNSNTEYEQYLSMGFDSDLHIEYYPSYKYGGVYLNSRENNLLINEFTITDIISENDTATVNGIFYDKLYKLTRYNYVFAFTSREHGLVKVWSNNISYRLIP